MYTDDEDSKKRALFFNREQLYYALLSYILFKGSTKDRNMNTLVDMISGMEAREDEENFLNTVDYIASLSCIVPSDALK